VTDTAHATGPVREPRPGRYPQTALALAGAVIGSLAIIAFLVIVVVRPDQTATRTSVDWHAAATAAQDANPTALDPQLPEGWTANVAQLGEDDGTTTWRIGLLSPAQGYVELEQGFDASDTWRPAAIAKAKPDSSLVIDGMTWQVVDQRGASDTGNYAYSLVARFPGSVVVLHGSGSDAEFETVAAASAASAAQLGTLGGGR